MNFEKIINVIDNRSSVDASVLAEVEMLHKKFPFTSLFPMMLLKGLKDAKNLHFDSELKNLAIQINDREVLERYLSEKLASSPILTEEVQNLKIKVESEEINTDVVNEELIPEEKEIKDVVLAEELKENIKLEDKAPIEKVVQAKVEKEDIAVKNDKVEIEAESEIEKEVLTEVKEEDLVIKEEKVESLKAKDESEGVESDDEGGSEEVKSSKLNVQSEEEGGRANAGKGIDNLKVESEVEQDSETIAQLDEDKRVVLDLNEQDDFELTEAEALLEKLKAQISSVEKEVQLSKKSAKKKKKKEKKEKKKLEKVLAEQQSNSPFKFKEFKGEDEEYYHLEIDFSDLEPIQVQSDSEEVVERFDFEGHPEIDEIIEENTVIKESKEKIKPSSDKESTFSEPVEVKVNEQTEMTFLDWLKINKKKVALEKKEKNQPKNTLINKFIEDGPSISQPKKEFYSPTKNAKKSLEDDLEIVTQTLAELHVFQQNYSKAKKIYKRLILKNPEKKSLFAQKLEEISELQKKN